MVHKLQCLLGNQFCQSVFSFSREKGCSKGDLKGFELSLLFNGEISQMGLAHKGMSLIMNPIMHWAWSQTVQTVVLPCLILQRFSLEWYFSQGRTKKTLYNKRLISHEGTYILVKTRLTLSLISLSSGWLTNYDWLHNLWIINDRCSLALALYKYLSSFLCHIWL